MSRFKEVGEASYYRILNDFCKGYLEHSERLWIYAEEEIKLIDAIEKKAYIDIRLGEPPAAFKHLNISDLPGHFNKQRIAEYEKIDQQHKAIILKQINDYLKKNIMHSEALKLYIPESDDLGISKYYVNYLKIKDIMPFIELKINMGYKK